MSNFVSSDLIYASDDAIKGLEVLFTDGDAADQPRIITGFTASSDTASTTPDFGVEPAGGDHFDLYDPRIADTEMLNLWIKLAIESVQEEYGIPWEDEVSIVGQSVLQNGGFEDWSLGSALAPDGWERASVGGEDRDSGVGRATAVKGRGLYSASLDCGIGATSALLYQLGSSFLVPFTELLGHTVTLKALVHADTAAVASVNIVGVASGTATLSNTGTGWETLTASLAIDATEQPGNFYVSFEALSGYTIYIAQASLTVAGHSVYEYYLPKRFARTTSLLKDNGTDYAFNEEIPARYYTADFANDRLVFNKAYYTPVSGAHYKLVGEAYQALPVNATDTIEIPLNYIIAYCRMLYLKLRQPANTSGIYYALAEVEREKRKLPKRPRANRRMAR